MISLVLQALGKMITNTVSPHSDITLRYDQDLDVVSTLKKNPELQTRQDAEIFENETQSSFLLGLFKRDAFQKRALGRHTTLTLLSENPADPKNWAESFATYGEVAVTYRIASRQLDVLEAFELFYNARIRPYGNLSMNVRLSEGNDAPEIPLWFDISCGDVNDISQISGSEYGSLWALDFTIRVLGFFITPDQTTYPKLKTVFLRAHFGSPHKENDRKYCWTILKKDLDTNTITQEDNVRLP